MKHKGVAKAVFISAYTLVLYLVVYQFFGAALVIKFRDRISATTAMMVSQLVTIPFVIYPLIRTGKLPGEKKSKVWEGILWVIGSPMIGLVLNIVLARIPSLLEDEAFQESYSALTSGGILPVIILSGVIAPMLEEFVFRGVVFGQFCGVLGPAAGIAISSVIFGIVHFNIPQFIYGTAMGVILGLIYYRTKKLWVSILAHSFTNLFIVFLGMLARQ